MEIPVSARQPMPAIHPLRAVGTVAALLVIAAALVVGMGYAYSEYAQAQAQAGQYYDPNFLLFNASAEVVTVYLTPLILAAGFWLAVLRLGQESWRRVWVDALALNVALLVVTGAIFGVMLFLAADVSNGTQFAPFPLAEGVWWYLRALARLPLMLPLLLGLAVGCSLLSVQVALFFTRWSHFQAAQRRPIVNDLLAVLMGSSFVILDYAAVLPVLGLIINHFIRNQSAPTNGGTILLVFVLTISAPPAIIAGFGAWQGWRRVRRGEVRAVASAKPLSAPPSDDDVLFSYGAIED